MAAQVNPALRSSASKETARTFRTIELQYRRVLRKQPSEAQALYALGDVHFHRGDDAETIRLLQHALHMQPKYSPAYRRLGGLFYQLKRPREAAAVYLAWARGNPADPEAQHMALAAAGGEIPDRCTVEYVAAHFDRFAAKFDEILLKRLAYRGPEIVATELAAHVGPPAGQLDLLDAGCGTGLCGARVHAWSRTLVGADLSEKMIARARDRGLYSELAVIELCEFMDSRPAAFDSIVSADVLIYFGDLDHYMRSAYRALRAGGILIATAEALVDDPETSYRLGLHGRYSHGEKYIRISVSGAGLSLLKLAPELLRWEMGQRVEGYVIVAGKTNNAS